MSAYRYVAFPSGSAPAVDELRRFRGYAELLNNHIAYGVRKRDAALTIACEAEPFDRLRGLDPAFEELLMHWRARGAEIEEKLPFAKDPTRWRQFEKSAEKSTDRVAAKGKPAAAAPEPPVAGPEPRSDHHRAADARAAEGLARLATARAAARGEAYQRWAAALPYLFWAIGVLLLVGAGVWVGARIRSPGVESRSQTVERVADDALKERLDTRRQGNEPVAEDGAPAEQPD
ncbi:hypothetical protein [Botrimarina sp.]|uniref:hypothetical protein n=1 Tax=Botrimarina sp. TaxID=2795802 RepID=UPI0032F045CD